MNNTRILFLNEMKHNLLTLFNLFKQLLLEGTLMQIWKSANIFVFIGK